jgi:hypothetical protein
VAIGIAGSMSQISLLSKTKYTTGIMDITSRNSSKQNSHRNNLGQLANAHEYPVIDPSFDDDHLKQITQY